MDALEMTLNEITNEHYLPAKWSSRRGHTVYGYESSIRRNVLPEWGEYTIQEITRKGIELWVARLTEARGAGGAWKAFKCLRQIIRWAIQEWSMLVIDPTVGVEKPRSPKYRPIVLSAKEAKKRIRGMWDHEFEPTHIIESDLGTRPGEAYALDWEDIRWTDGRVLLNKTLQYWPGHLEIYPTKTAKGDREGWLSKQARQRLHAIWILRGRPKGRIIGDAMPYSVAGKIKRWAKKIKLPTVTMQNLRHTFATLSIEAGVPLEVVAMMMGHSSYDVCYDNYFVGNKQMCVSAQKLRERLLTGA